MLALNYRASQVSSQIPPVSLLRSCELTEIGSLVGKAQLTVFILEKTKSSIFKALFVFEDCKRPLPFIPQVTLLTVRSIGGSSTATFEC